MTDQTGRPDDENRPDGTPEQTPDAQPDRGESAPESVLTGFSWDDPSGAAPTRPDDSEANASSEPQGGEPSYGSSAYVPQAPEAPAQYPPAAPYPPAPPGASSDPYGQAPGQQYGQQGQGEPYGQQPTPYAPQSTGYGQSAEYTATPQPYAYGPPPLTPDAEKARSNAVLWTILNGVAIFLCGNLLAIAGVILAAVAIGKARVDVESSRNLTKWSWILFATGFALGALLIIVIIFGFIGTAGLSSEFSSL